MRVRGGVFDIGEYGRRARGAFSRALVGLFGLTGPSLKELYSHVDVRLTSWMAKYGLLLLRISLGIVFFWFGVLKFFPNLSPAEALAARTIMAISFGVLKPAVSLPILATWECLIGLGLITGKYLRATLLLFFLQMVGTVIPLFLFPDETWTHFSYAPTLEGQYILKNIVLVSAALVIGATVRGGKSIVPDAVRRIEGTAKETSTEAR
jgi:uncharacterized membrane protein YkgB